MLDKLFKPRAVAIIGASNNPLSIGHIVITNLVNHGFKGPIYPINPKSEHIRSLRAYKSIMDVPGEVDLVNISIKNTLVPKVLEECGKKGVKYAIVHTAGFKEVGEEGRKLEREIVEVAHKYGMRIYGPNSQGIQNSDPEVSVYANFTFVPMTPGNLSIVAQSGGVGEVFKAHLYEDAGMGIRMYSSFGNEADVKMNEIIEHYGEDEGTRAILVHIETLSDAKGFLDVAGKITPKKPILALKTGRTPEGAVAVSSHTGTLVEQDTISEAIFDKTGVLRMPSEDDLIQTGIAFSSQPAPEGNSVAVITNTGGPGIIAVDELISSGLKLAKLTDETKEILRNNLHAEATISNPVDVVATATPEHYGITVETLLKDPNVDSLLINFVTAPFVDLDGIADRIAEAGKTATKPILCCVMTIEKWAYLIDKIRSNGIPVYDFPETAAKVLVYMSRYGQIKRRAYGKPPVVEANSKKAAQIIQASREGFMSQADAIALMETYGVKCAPTRKVTSKDELAAAADAVGFPAVLKVDSAAVVHKTEAGALTLNLENMKDLEAAFDRLQSLFEAEKPDYIVQKMMPKGREIIIGSKKDPQAGPLLMFGLGGIFVEVMKDVVFKLAPLSREEAMEMVKTIKAYPLLEGFRGDKGVDIDALADLLIRVSNLTVDNPAIQEMDLNPVIVYEKGEAPAVVDARIMLAAK
ncbi:acetate--CoA ligase family protein [Acidobacteriota bacterium]